MTQVTRRSLQSVYLRPSRVVFAVEAAGLLRYYRQLYQSRREPSAKAIFQVLKVPFVHLAAHRLPRHFLVIEWFLVF
jgi:hypothetical protein